MKKEITYRTFSDLLNEVGIDMTILSAEGMIEPASLIKIAQKCNYDLGLRIHSSKDAIVDINYGKGKLPDDFYVLNYATICASYKTCDSVLSGRHTEDVLTSTLPACTRCGCDEDPEIVCTCEVVYCAPDCSKDYTVVHKKKYEIREYKEFAPIYFKPGKCVEKSCYNTRISADYTAEINSGFIKTDLNVGTVYLNYEGALEDDEGNLLVLDHPMINEYYEYAIKERILENMYYAGEEVIQKLQYTQEKLRVARNNAFGIVNTPDFNEIKAVFDMNRKAMYNKYYKMFASN